MQDEKLYSLEEAAALLQVSKDTVRRRIRTGELVAEKRNGPYGPQYFLPADQFNVATQEIEVQRVTRQVAVGELEAIVSQRLAQTVQAAVTPIMDELQQLKEQNQQLHEEIHMIKTSQEAVEDANNDFMKRTMPDLISSLTANSRASEEHFKNLDERLRQISEKKQETAADDSFLVRLRKLIQGE